LISSDLDAYKTLIFDCDGVILNSNEIKTEAFYDSVLTYGKESAEKFKEYHENNGGISRYRKFQYFFENILNKPMNSNDLERLLGVYSNLVLKKLSHCQINPYLNELKDFTRNAKWGVVSGGDQRELRAIFSKRKISGNFELGIFGSPETKEEIFDKMLRNKLIDFPAIFFGDSQYDFEVAESISIDFLFISCWTEFSNWQDYQKIKQFDYVNNFNELIKKK